MDSNRRSTHIAVSIGMLLAAIALLLPIRMDGWSLVNNARAEGETCWVNPDLRCCVMVTPIWWNCIEESSWEPPVDPEG
jgi:hypothetical protein